MISNVREEIGPAVGRNAGNSEWFGLAFPEPSSLAQLIPDEDTMGEIPNDIDRAVIEAHAQRTVERTALRKVRKTLDQIEEAEAAGRRTLRQVLIACAILVLLGACVVWWLVFSGRDLPQASPMKLPGTLPQKQ